MAMSAHVMAPAAARRLAVDPLMAVCVPDRDARFGPRSTLGFS
jgi:hypothetical protein